MLKENNKCDQYCNEKSKFLIISKMPGSEIGSKILMKHLVKYGLNPASFCLFYRPTHNSMRNILKTWLYKLKKCRSCARDSNPGRRKVGDDDAPELWCLKIFGELWWPESVNFKLDQLHISNLALRSMISRILNWTNNKFAFSGTQLNDNYLWSELELFRCRSK